MDAAPPARYDNARFFGDHARHQGPASIPEETFYAAARPPPELGLATWTALTPMRFSLVIFLVGWAGILFQASFLQQVVFGAPVFEELAKVGLALVIANALGLRASWLRLPLAWASGAAFGVLEHVTTYPDEETWLYAGRVLFHGATAGLSMSFYQAFEHMEDVRARWATTAVPTLLHWANNFGAVALSVASIVLPVSDPVATGWAGLVTAIVVGLGVAALVVPAGFRALSQDTLRRLVPTLAREAEGEPAAPLPDAVPPAAEDAPRGPP